MRDGFRVVDADGHVIEPHSIWTTYLDPAFRDRAPKPVGMTFGFEFDGFSVNTPREWEPSSSSDDVARRSERIQATYAELFPAAHAAGFSADSHLAAMDTEGVDTTFLYPSSGLFVIATDDIAPSLATALARAYNDWLVDYCATDPKRLHGVGMVALHDPGEAAVEAARVHDLGFRGLFIRPNPVGGRNLDDPSYDQLWAVMSDLEMTLGIHEGGFPRLPQVVRDRISNSEQAHICTHPMEQMIASVSLIYGGVLERYPGLRVAFLEAGCGWVPYWLHRMDEHWDNALTRDYGGSRSLRLAPSEYFRRQCYVSADAEEYMLQHVIDLIGDDRIVFSTDYPHPDSPWPKAVETFLGLPGVTTDSKRKILWDNALDLYRNALT